MTDNFLPDRCCQSILILKEPMMERTPILDEVLDAAEQLDDESQAELVAILGRRLAERGRARVIADVEAARREFSEGKCQSMSAEEIVREARP